VDHRALPLLNHMVKYYRMAAPSTVFRTGVFMTGI
jgi:hypothetical protein